MDKVAMHILVTGAQGQLGMEFRELSARYPEYQFHFTSRNELDVCNRDAVMQFFKTHPLDFCIHCAAYTAVDLAETQREAAMQGNAHAPTYVAEACTLFGVKLFHFSTDYVFNGKASAPYLPHDPVEPVNYYGATKLQGEEQVMKYCDNAIIIRTSWVYSFYGKNFVKTMLRLMQERDTLRVVNDQRGCPTYAADLAHAVMQIIAQQSFTPGVYHYCNSGVISWFQFASAIAKHMSFNCIVEPIRTEDYPTPAKRPAYSALNTDSFSKAFHIEIPDWESSLKQCLQTIQQRG
ncbi:MAG: dTDP-4-dehydrorhamnose reductase [Ferruginibacter sp.]|nr:dTDP-4-dehydrorhamnose reductase [Ferruginibacter sp.]